MISIISLDSQHQGPDNIRVLFNSGTGLGGLNTKADSRPMRHFFRPSDTIGTSSMSSHGGSVHARAGSFVPVRQSCHVLDTLLGGGMLSLTLAKEATMPSITRSLSRLFPIANPIATAATPDEAQAIARQHLARTGRAVRITPAAQGFAIVKVRV
nr:hypothetical protein [Chromobacterium sp. ASV5]